MTDLGTLPGGFGSHAMSINDRGQIVGSALDVDFSDRAVIWDDGAITNLGLLPGHGISTAHLINERGDVAGVSCSVDEIFLAVGCHAVLWPERSRSRRHESGDDDDDDDDDDRAAGIDPGTLPGKERSFPYALNNRGEIVGESCDENEGSIGACRAFLWKNGRMTDVTPPLPGVYRSSALLLNDRGQFVVEVWTETGSHAFVWDHGGLIELDRPGPFYRVTAMNDRGQMAGFALNPPFAVVWTRSSCGDSNERSEPVLLGDLDPDDE